MHNTYKILTGQWKGLTGKAELVGNNDNLFIAIKDINGHKLFTGWYKQSELEEVKT